MTFGLDDAFTILVDPSGTLLATKKTAETTAEAAASGIDTIAGATGRGNEKPHASPPGAQTTAACCDRFQLQGEFLVDSLSGTVWRYDKGADTFKMIPREKPEIQKRAEGLLWFRFANDLLDAKSSESTKLHHSVRRPFEGHVDSMIDAVGKHLKTL